MRAAGEATRRRILAEARREFAAHGLAGARVNRIAANAQASKERLYAYYPSKDDLFAAVWEQVVNDTSDETEFRAADAAEYVGRLFDVYTGDPDTLNLQDRLHLEANKNVGGFRPLIGERFAAKLDEVRRGQGAGLIDPLWDPAELLEALIGIARTMARESPMLHEFQEFASPETERGRRRRTAVRAAEKLIAP